MKRYAPILILAAVAAFLLWAAAFVHGGTINVPAGGDLRAAIVNAKAGDIVQPQSGTFILDTVDVPDGVTIDGGATIQAPDTKFALRVGGGRVATIKNLKFRGGAISIQGEARLKVEGCDFTAFDNGGDVGAGRGAIGGGGAVLISSSINRCNFHDSPNGRAVYFFTAIDSSISDNTFATTFLGIKSNNANIRRSNNLRIERNTFTGQVYHCTELQGCIDGFWYTGNTIKDQRFSNSNAAHFGASLIYTPGGPNDAGGNFPSTDQHILNNTFIGPVNAQGKPILPLGLEAGQNAEISNNIIENFITGLTIYGGGGRVTNNRIKNWSFNATEKHGPNSGTTIETNNGPDVPATGAGAVPAPSIAAPGNVKVTPTSDRTVLITWENRAADATANTIKLISTVGRETGPKVGPRGSDNGTVGVAASAKSANLEGIHPGWMIDFIVTVTTPAGQASSAPVTVQMPGDGATSPWPSIETTPPATQPIPPAAKPIVRIIAPSNVEIKVEQAP